MIQKDLLDCPILAAAMGLVRALETIFSYTSMDVNFPVRGMSTDTPSPASGDREKLLQKLNFDHHEMFVD